MTDDLHERADSALPDLKSLPYFQDLIRDLDEALRVCEVQRDEAGMHEKKYLADLTAERKAHAKFIHVAVGIQAELRDALQNLVTYHDEMDCWNMNEYGHTCDSNPANEAAKDGSPIRVARSHIARPETNPIP